MSFEHLSGKKVKFDIVNKNGAVLVPADSVLNEDTLRLLQQHEINPFDVLVQAAEDHTPPGSPSKLIQEAANYSKHLYDRLQYDRKVPLIEIKNQLIPVVRQISRHPDLLELFESVKAKDEYTHQHNIGVGVLSTLIGQWLNLEESELALLSLAATIHDIGKVRIPQEVLLKPGKLTKEEFDEMKRHTIYGYEILKGTVGLSPRVMLVALQHHERLDGTGYPLHLKKGEIDLWSQIVAVADVFHAISSKRPYQDPMPFYKVVTLMRQGSFGELNPEIVSLLLDKFINALLGKKVVLTDGCLAEVVHINSLDDLHPLVKIEDSLLDLSRNRDIHIQQILS
ncbi:HD domain-containing protein [Paenibacillus sophorae]|uniref:HD domain-containing protein n=2 Tax=Paenibacillus sophorae TaxID=1333845 RepID=A0A1H8RTC0_9BACL|nr:HD-GYP domain-containing protein [Paenibacillus sophorae]QWU18210.1 HD-GYP domain-containing protein [Paenibacillus sophorae]SEO69711.1 HD domain-containing protein [Paenibacillus sophorae]